MTCHTALALLEDYIDGDLSDNQAAQVKEHIGQCDRCREEHSSSVLLRELLKQRRSPDPGPDYWRETSSLIRARTVESAPADLSRISVSEQVQLERGAFLRAVLSVAASLVVLFSAILLGSSQPQRLARVNANQPPLLARAAILDQIEADNTIELVNSADVQLAKGMLLMGPPGALGRFVAPMNMSFAAK